MLIGASSMIGKHFKNSSASKSFDIVDTSRNKDSSDGVFLDLADTASIDRISLSGYDLAIIFSCITNQDKCKKNPKLATKINVVNTIKLLKRLSENKIYTIFPSTSLIYDGASINKEDETEPEPIGIYGKNKYIVEREIANFFSENIVILRISKVIDKDFKIFKNWCESFLNQKNVHPFSNLNFSPVSIEVVNQVISNLLKQKALGVFNLSSSDQLSYAEAAIYLAKKYKQQKNMIFPVNALEKIKDIHLPKHSSLDCRKLSDLGVRQPLANESLDYFVKFNDFHKRDKE